MIVCLLQPNTPFGTVGKVSVPYLHMNADSPHEAIDSFKLVKKALSFAKLADHTQQIIGKRTIFSHHMTFLTYVPSLHMHCSCSLKQTEEQAHH